MTNHEFIKATLTKTEIMRYLGIGEIRLKKLLANSAFPQPKPIIEKWSKAEIDCWLNKKEEQIYEKNQDWRSYIG